MYIIDLLQNNLYIIIPCRFLFFLLNHHTEAKFGLIRNNSIDKKIEELGIKPQIPWLNNYKLKIEFDKL